MYSCIVGHSMLPYNMRTWLFPDFSAADDHVTHFVSLGNVTGRGIESPGHLPRRGKIGTKRRHFLDSFAPKSLLWRRLRV